MNREKPLAVAGYLLVQVDTVEMDDFLQVLIPAVDVEMLLL